MSNGSPIGGTWSFDQENRKKLAKDITVPEQPSLSHSKHVRDAIQYVELDNFESNKIELIKSRSEEFLEQLEAHA